tara:strand:- start:1026 stop:1250 length:225 start_codon:yes stop_codon:yes gene_type:complete
MSDILKQYVQRQNSNNNNQVTGPPAELVNGGAGVLYQMQQQKLTTQTQKQKGTDVGLNDFQKLQEMMATLSKTG